MLAQKRLKAPNNVADEVQQTGTVDHTSVYPRKVVKRVLELSATAIALVHKRPGRTVFVTPAFRRSSQ